MMQLSNFVLSIYIIFILIDSIVGIFLTYKIIKNHVYFVSFYVIILLLYIIEIAFLDLNPGIIPGFTQALFAMTYSIFYILFTKFTYYKKRKSAFWPLLIIIISIKIIHFIVRLSLGYTVPLFGRSLEQDEIFPYYFHVVLTSSLHLIPLIWLTIASLKAYRRAKVNKLNKWVQYRNLLIGISSAIFLLPGVLWFFVPVDGTAFSSSSGFLIGIVLFSSNVLNMLVNMVAWFVPSFIFNLLKNEIIVEISTDDAGQSGQIEEVRDILTNKDIMLLVDFIGNQVSESFGIKPSAAKGLIVLSLKDEYGDIGLYCLHLSKMKEVLMNSLKKRLETLKIDNLDKKLSRIYLKLVENQSIILSVV
ncbi:MAG: hypothetical protein ACTSVI_04625 [Promethearchaeota archaeon]